MSSGDRGRVRRFSSPPGYGRMTAMPAYDLVVFKTPKP
jgi:hypothetical protein